MSHGVEPWLNLTDRRLAFQPNTVEALIGLRCESWDRSRLCAATVVEGRRGLATWRRRVRVELTDGELLHFVVWTPEAAVAELSALLAFDEPSH